MKSAQHCLYNSGKGRYLGCMWNNAFSYFGITFLLFFMKRENAVLHILPKISNEHIKLTSYSKMNVRLAAQVLSSVSKVLLAYSPPEAAETASFCSLMD